MRLGVSASSCQAPQEMENVPVSGTDKENGSLYLSSVFIHDMSVGNPDVIDRRSRGLQRPWDSMAHHVHILNKPEQLRGPQSPHRKAGPQNREARVYLRLLTERMSLDMRRYLSILDIQDSC